MKKKYLRIETSRDGAQKNITFLLLTDNISGWSFEVQYRSTRLYFHNANPFAFINLYMSNEQFFDLMRGNIKTYVVKKEGSDFDYSIIEL